MELSGKIGADFPPTTDRMLGKCPNLPPTPAPHSFQSYVTQLQVAVPGAPSRLGHTALDPPLLLGWDHLLAGPSGEEPGAGLGWMRGSRVGQRGLGSSRRKEEETVVQRGAGPCTSHTAKPFNMTAQEKVDPGT